MFIIIIFSFFLPLLHIIARLCLSLSRQAFKEALKLIIFSWWFKGLFLFKSTFNNKNFSKNNIYIFNFHNLIWVTKKFNLKIELKYFNSEPISFHNFPNKTDFHLDSISNIIYSQQRVTELISAIQMI